MRVYMARELCYLLLAMVDLLMLLASHISAYMHVCSNADEGEKRKTYTLSRQLNEKPSIILRFQHTCMVELNLGDMLRQSSQGSPYRAQRHTFLTSSLSSRR